ncbi:MAG: RIP metalloprotease RseP [Bdellovibrionales bacterium]|nr:RIP metalloprotease RseP [Bdellovibrionales bacterium]
MFSNVIIPILLFGILVFIHELGHFSVAKLSGVFVERFSIGFGPAIFRKTWGETEYALCLLPLGGYVKMRGEETIESEEAQAKHKNDPRSFDNQNVWTRIAIASMGPIFNLILPIILFTFLFWVGIPKMDSTVAYVDPQQSGWAAGLRPGDRILSVENKLVQSWEDLTHSIQNRGGLLTTLEILRDGSTKTLEVTPDLQPGTTAYGESMPVGKLGISPQGLVPALSVLEGDLLESKGFEQGDYITHINGQAVSHWWQIDSMLASSAEIRSLTARRGNEEISASFDKGQISSLRKAQLRVEEVQKDSAAEVAGLQTGDYIESLNGALLHNWTDFQKAVSESQGQSLTLGIIRGTDYIKVEVTPKESSYVHPMTKEKLLHYQVGLQSMAIPADISTYTDQGKNFFDSIIKGTRESWDVTVSTVIGMGKLFTGKVSVNSLGGPISIFSMASSSYKNGGWVSFFRLMAILSITLGVLNLLPVPVLDGGHLVFYFIEVIKGSPLNMKARQWAQQIGVVMVLGLMALVFYVDINRFFVDKIKNFFQ